MLPTSSSPEQIAAHCAVELRRVVFELVGDMTHFAESGICEPDEIKELAMRQREILAVCRAFESAPAPERLRQFSRLYGALEREVRDLRAMLEYLANDRALDLEGDRVLAETKAAMAAGKFDAAEALSAVLSDTLRERRALVVPRTRRPATVYHPSVSRIALGPPRRRSLPRRRTPRRAVRPSSTAIPSPTDDGPPAQEPPQRCSSPERASLGRLNLPAEWARLPATVRVDDIAGLLGCDRKTLYAAAARGELPGAYRIGRRILVVRDALFAELFPNGWAPPRKRSAGGGS